jgi:NAD-dependent SIR2 family protein deacetylase
MSHPLDLESNLALAAQWLEEADGLVVAAGAGMGVDSGLPDFRGNEGMWQAYPALGRAKRDFAAIANPDAFQRDPQLAWGFYGHRLALYRSTQPHQGFELLQQFAQRMPHGLFAVTSNVDGQFQAAGIAIDRIHELHGSIHVLQCTRPCTPQLWSAADVDPKVDPEHCRLQSSLPRCPNCGAHARPNILMFGDGAWVSDRTDLQSSKRRAWLSGVTRPIVVEVGAGVHIPSVRNFSEHLLKTKLAKLIRINPRDTAVPDRNAVSLPLGALEGLQALGQRLHRD